MNKSILALSVVAAFAAFAPSAQAGWYDGYYGRSSSRTWCEDEDGDLVRCKKYKSVLPSIPGVPGSLQRTVEGLLGVSPSRKRGCRVWSRSEGDWVRVPCDD
jgi:hypothetical protein